MADPRVAGGVVVRCPCGTSFKAWLCTITAGQAKHCSKACADRARRKPDHDVRGMNTGRWRAQVRFRDIGICERCQVVPAVDRHHRDGDTLNNSRRNVMFLCKRCHMTVDGRLRRFAGARFLGESNPAARLTWPDVVLIRQLWRPGLIQVLAARFGVGTSTIHRVVTGQSWKAEGR